MATRNISVHPMNYHPSTLTQRSFDIIVIGGGPVANFAEDRLAKAGLSVLVVQHERTYLTAHCFVS
jgi:pyruvate/2-oxoglutarate dehydrogenase complex dihydrolipoamide dehydrogenase (E3) component